MSSISELTDSTFKQEVLDSITPVLVDFTAEWCGPCYQLVPIVEQIAKEYDGRMRVGRLDIDQSLQTTMQYGVMSVPTLILFKSGQPVERITGFMSKQRIEEKLKKHLQ